MQQTKRFLVTLHGDLYLDLCQIANADYRTINQQVVKAIHEHVRANRHLLTPGTHPDIPATIPPVVVGSPIYVNPDELTDDMLDAIDEE